MKEQFWEVVGVKSGGETGIRTRGAFGTHAFQACTIDHSDISPVISTGFHKKKRS